MCDAAGKRLARLIMKALKPPSIKRDPVEELPEEILHLIWRLLDLNDLLSASLVCRSWNQSLSNDNVWKRYINKSEKCPTSLVPRSSKEDNSRTSWKKKFLSQRSLVHNWSKNKYHTEIKTPITGMVSATNELLCIWSDKSVDLISPLNTSTSIHISNQFGIKSVQTTKDSDWILIVASNHFAHLYKSDKAEPLLVINLNDSAKSNKTDLIDHSQLMSNQLRSDLVNNNDAGQFRDNLNLDANRLNENSNNNNNNDETENVNNELEGLLTNQQRVDANQILNETVNQAVEQRIDERNQHREEMNEQRNNPSNDQGNQLNQQGNLSNQIDNLTNQQGNQSVPQVETSNQLGNLTDQLGNQSIQQGNLSHRIENSTNQEGNQSNQQRDLMNQVENLSNQIGNQSNQIGNQSNQLGNQSNQLGNPSNQLRNPYNQLGNHSNPIGNQSNQLGNQSNQLNNPLNQQGNQSNQLGNPNQLANQSNRQNHLDEPIYEIKLTPHYLCVYKSDKFTIYDLTDFSQKSIQIPECKKISSFNLLKSAILVRFEPLDYNYEAIYTIYDFSNCQWSIITKISTTPLGHREHYEYVFNDYYLLVNYLLIDDTYMYSNVYIYNKLKPINREIISNNHRKYFIANFTQKLCVFTVADYRLLALDLICSKTKEIYVTANFTDLMTVLNRFFVLKFSDRIEVWDVKFCKRLYSIRFSDRDNVLVRDKFVAVTSFPGTSLPKSLRVLNFTEPELCEKFSSVCDLSGYV